MAEPNRNAPSFDVLLQEQRRKKAEELRAQAILGSNRSRTPGGPRQQGLNGSLASRAGVMRRPASVPRTNSAPAPRAAARPPLTTNTRSNRPRETHADDYYDARDTYPQQLQQQPPARQANTNAKSNGRAPARAPPAANNFSVRGAAKNEPYIVMAENFALGTTAADIEAVMFDVGGKMHSCRLLSLEPVVAEMVFVDRQGAELVIKTFDGKMADGVTLEVYWKGQRSTRQRSPAAVGFVVDTEPTPDDAMEVDEQTRDREEQNRLREERRGAAPRGPANEPQRDARDRGGRSGGYPSGPRADRGGQYDNRGSYNDGRYSNGGGGGGGGGGRRYDGGGRGGRGYPQHGQRYQS